MKAGLGALSAAVGAHEHTCCSISVKEMLDGSLLVMYHRKGEHDVEQIHEDMQKVWKWIVDPSQVV